MFSWWTCLWYRFCNKHLPSSHHPIFYCLVSHSTSNHIQRLMLQSVAYRFCKLVRSLVDLFFLSLLCMGKTNMRAYRTYSVKVWIIVANELNWENLLRRWNENLSHSASWQTCFLLFCWVVNSNSMTVNHFHHFMLSSSPLWQTKVVRQQATGLL